MKLLKLDDYNCMLSLSTKMLRKYLNFHLMISLIL